MYKKVHSIGILGVEGYPVLVEADASDGLPMFVMVGYLASEVKEAQDRVRTAVKNSGFRLQAQKITVNLSPADVRKEGTAFDLPIAIAVLAAYGLVDPCVLESSVISGELGLDGEVKPLRGALSITEAAKKDGKKRCFLPMENVREGLITEGIDVIGVATLRQLADFLNSPQTIAPAVRENLVFQDAWDQYDVDFSEVSGQFLLRRATEIAVAGMHNILYIGPPGTGKTMVARRIPTIMPALSLEENIEISKVYSVCGCLPKASPLLSRRPFRSPHHTISPQALTGGGRIPRPGELSLASRGVLFLDELPEFQRNTIEILRQPLEEQTVTISRVYGSYEFPAHIMLCAAMNPCKCGYYPDRTRCACSEGEVRRYLNRIPKPLLDRIDICIEAAPITYAELQDRENGESSAAIRKRVEAARAIQETRFAGTGIYFNGSMKESQLDRFCCLESTEEAFLKQVYEQMELTARGYKKVLKVARTIADLDESETIKRNHLAEAVELRGMEEKYWGMRHG